jgi:hypothetical protein
LYSMLRNNITSHNKIIELYRQEIADIAWHCQSKW